jgi:Uma2 family endonuclease
MSSNAPKQIKPIYYPESDGEPMAETPEHIELMIDLRFALRNHFHDAPKVYLGVKMFMYYVEGNPKKCVAPDLFVVCDAPQSPPRRTWKTWEEDRVPDVVIELSSRKTFEENLQKKWLTYAEIGVAEYYIFDPFYDFLDRPLLAYRLEGDEFVNVEVVDGVVMSEALGLELVDTGETLRLRHPAT